jgi:hypothetical protein
MIIDEIRFSWRIFGRDGLIGMRVSRISFIGGDIQIRIF